MPADEWVMAAPRVRVTLYLTPEILKKINREAAIAKISRSAFIEAVLRRYLSGRKSVAQRTTA